MPNHLELEVEQAVVAAAKEGDADAFTKLVSLYEGSIYRMTLGITRNEQDAEDAMQEAFMKAYTHLHTFEGESRFFTWLTRIAANEALMRLRKRRGESTYCESDRPEGDDDDPSSPMAQVADGAENPEEICARREMQAQLSHALSCLKPEMRSVVLLRDAQGFSNEEVADMLGLTVAAVKARLVRGRLLLQKRFTVARNSRTFILRSRRKERCGSFFAPDWFTHSAPAT